MVSPGMAEQLTVCECFGWAVEHGTMTLAYSRKNCTDVSGMSVTVSNKLNLTPWPDAGEGLGRRWRENKGRP